LTRLTGGGRRSDGPRWHPSLLDQDVVAGPAVEDVLPGATAEYVVTGATEQRVVAVAAVDDVVALTAVGLELDRVSGQSTAAPSPAAAPAGNGSGAASIMLAQSNLGKVLVNSKGQTLYLWQADKGSTSTCSGACASAWPPVTTKGAPVAGPGLSSAKLGTTMRSDGTTEVTYNGHPLYTFVGDSSPGQATGEGNPGFGAEWDVVSAAGNKIETGS
jgi:predicted lipoprotein with Yx(FWY)xxD motif